MKLLFYIHGLSSGGAERVLVTLANHFVERGDEVTISCAVEQGVCFDVDSRVKIFDHRQGCYDTSLRKKYALFRFIQTLRNMRRIEKEMKPDVAISFITTFNIYTIFCLLFRRVPVIVSEHTHVGVKLPLREYIGRELTYPLANAITVLTRHDYLLWKKRYRGVVRMPNPCESLSDVSDGPEIKEKVVLAAGRVTSWHLKGFDNLIKSWCKICNEFPEWKLQIAGSLDDDSSIVLMDIVKQNNGKNVELLGFRSDVYDLMSKSEIYVLSSRREGLPMTLIEAMSKGCCCVSFDVETGPADIIVHNKNGLLVKNQSVEELSKALSLVMSDDNLRKQLSENAPEGVQSFEVWNIIKRWDILFKKLGVEA